ncbi:hypothetical protein Emtol_0714 [Emticicia oligotrophica DSM 17448]|uniref:DUF4595 domain-containing protein n=1 Tax=Emticicia oligotrophica (strain DSM 17448 / CIP 109782 / MTCC 6937 / GPTSA100-15) TaxID=929562 RepID=A0ABM5MXL3_EMTOG|nr:hypothetical protein [Emticicia oligotrophica]AFK01867.1 hypothetical protein Emtol_0714 [Emticicia oligotrophica DSM 17448]
MFSTSNKYALLFSLLTTVCLLSCGDKEIQLLIRPNSSTETTTQNICYLKAADNGHGINYNFNYNTDNQIIKIDGFPDFNQISYENNLPKKVNSTFDDTYYVEYSYDNQGTLTMINFIGKDSRNKPFQLKSKVYTNSQKQAERIDLNLPVFDQIIVTKIEYDGNGNIRKINIVENNTSKVILENLEFDNHKSPYINASLANTMLYFTIFSAITGGENTTYFQNQNNPTLSKIYTDNGEVTYSYNYEYTSEEYPSKIKVIRKQNNVEEKYEENLIYNCIKTNLSK